MARTGRAENTINRKALRAGFGYTIGIYLVKAAAFVFVPVFARLMSTEDFGLFGAFSSYESLYYLAAGLALHTSFKNARLRYDYESGNGDYQRYVSDVVLLIFMHFAAALVLVFPFRLQAAQILGLPVPSLYLLMIYSFGAAVISCWYAESSLDFDFRGYLLVYAVYGVGAPLAGIFLMLTGWTETAALARMSGVALFSGIPALCIAVSFFRRMRPGEIRRLIPWGLKYSIPAIPGGISQIILTEFDRIMILRMEGRTAAGIYSLAFQVILIGNIALQVLENVWIPWFYRMFRGGEHALIRRMARLITILMTVFYASLLLLSPELVMILGGETYRSALPCVLPMLCGGFYAFLYIFPSSVEFYYEKTVWNAAVAIGCAVLNIVLNRVFIARAGYEAAAWTTFFCYLVYAAVHFALARYLLEGKVLFPAGTILGAALFVPAAAFLSSLTRDLAAVRILLAALLCCGFMLYEEKNFGLLKNRIAVRSVSGNGEKDE